MMRHLAAFFLSMSPLVAGAQDFVIPSVTADAGVLLGCLGSGKAPATCVGAMTVDCQAENDLANDNLEERMCTVEELVIWRDLVAREQQQLRERLSQVTEADRAVLLGDPAVIADDARAQWGQWAQSHCRLERAAAGTGDRRAIVEDVCMRDLTAAQFSRLQGLNRAMDLR